MIVLCAAGQKNFERKPAFTSLQIGDTVPDVLINDLRNYPKSVVRFSEFKGKLVILDFWFGTCKGCLESFPKMERLQNKYAQQLQILTIDFETNEKIRSTFNKYRNVSSVYRLPKLPMITGDSLFHKLFEFRFYPHEVWIDENGVVKAFTSSLEVNEENIEAMLNHQPTRMKMKFDDMTFDSNQPLLSQLYRRNPGSLLFYSGIFQFASGTGGGPLLRTVIDSAAQTLRITRPNMSILQLFGNALLDGVGGSPFEEADFDFGKRVVLNVADSSKYFYPYKSGRTKGEWESENLYNYEAVLPLGQVNEAFLIMLKDLENYFQLSCKIEQRKMNCLALVRTSQEDKIKSKEGRSRSIFDQRRDTTKVQMFGQTTKWLVQVISSANRQIPFVFVDETGYKNRIDIEIDKKALSDIPMLKKLLRSKYDLDLIEMENTVDVLVLQEQQFLDTKEVKEENSKPIVEKRLSQK